MKRNVVCVDFDGGFLVNGGASGPDAEADGHSRGGDQEQGSTSDSVAHQGAKDGGTVVVDVEDTVNQGLGFRVGDSDTDENLGEVVGNQTVTGPLGEEGDGDDDQHSPLVALADKERLEAAAVVGFLFDLQGVPDLFEFVGGQRVRLVTSAMVLDENFAGSFLSTLVHQPTGRLGDGEDECNLGKGQQGSSSCSDATDLQDTGKTLQEGRDSPRPVVVDSEGTVCGPGGDDGTEVPRTVVERSQGASVGREGQLGNQERSGGTCETETETDDTSSGDEHADVLRSCLDGHTDKHDAGTHEDGHPTTESVACKGHKRKGKNATDRLRRSQTNDCATRHDGLPEWR